MEGNINSKFNKEAKIFKEAKTFQFQKELIALQNQIHLFR